MSSLGRLTMICHLLIFAYISRAVVAAGSCSTLGARDCRSSPVCKFKAKQCINKAGPSNKEDLMPAPTPTLNPACAALASKECRAHSDCSVTAGHCHSKGHTPTPTTATTITTPALQCLRRYLGPLKNTKAKNSFRIGGGSGLSTVEHCAALCTNVDGCLSFTFRAVKQLCRLYSTNQVSKKQVVTKPKLRQYEHYYEDVRCTATESSTLTTTTSTSTLTATSTTATRTSSTATSVTTTSATFTATTTTSITATYTSSTNTATSTTATATSSTTTSTTATSTTTTATSTTVSSTTTSLTTTTASSTTTSKTSTSHSTTTSTSESSTTSTATTTTSSETATSTTRTTTTTTSTTTTHKCSFNHFQEMNGFRLKEAFTIALINSIESVENCANLCFLYARLEAEDLCEAFSFSESEQVCRLGNSVLLDGSVVEQVQIVDPALPLSDGGWQHYVADVDCTTSTTSSTTTTTSETATSTSYTSTTTTTTVSTTTVTTTTTSATSTRTSTTGTSTTTSVSSTTTSSSLTSSTTTESSTTTSFTTSTTSASSTTSTTSFTTSTTITSTTSITSSTMTSTTTTTTTILAAAVQCVEVLGTQVLGSPISSDPLDAAPATPLATPPATTTTNLAATTIIPLSITCQNAMHNRCFHVEGLGVDSVQCIDCVEQTAKSSFVQFSNCFQETTATSSLSDYFAFIASRFCSSSSSSSSGGGDIGAPSSSAPVSTPTCSQHAAAMTQLVQQCGNKRINFHGNGGSGGNGDNDDDVAIDLEIEKILIPDIVCIELNPVNVNAVLGVANKDTVACPLVAAILSEIATEHNIKSNPFASASSVASSKNRVTVRCVGALFTIIDSELKTCSTGASTINAMLKLFSIDHGTQACKEIATPIVASHEITSVDAFGLAILSAPVTPKLGTCVGQATLLNRMLHDCGVLDNPAHVASCVPITFGFAQPTPPSLLGSVVLNDGGVACNDLASAISRSATEYNGPAGTPVNIECKGTLLAVGGTLSPTDAVAVGATSTINAMLEAFAYGGADAVCTVTTPTTSQTTTPTAAGLFESRIEYVAPLAALGSGTKSTGTCVAQARLLTRLLNQCAPEQVSLTPSTGKGFPRIACIDLPFLDLEDVFRIIVDDADPVASSSSCNAVAQALGAAATEFAGPGSPERNGSPILVGCSNNLLTMDAGQQERGIALINGMVEAYVNDGYASCEVTTPTTTATSTMVSTPTTTLTTTATTTTLTTSPTTTPTSSATTSLTSTGSSTVTSTPSTSVTSTPTSTPTTTTTPTSTVTSSQTTTVSSSQTTSPTSSPTTTVTTSHSTTPTTTTTPTSTATSSQSTTPTTSQYFAQFDCLALGSNVNSHFGIVGRPSATVSCTKQANELSRLLRECGGASDLVSAVECTDVPILDASNVLTVQGVCSEAAALLSTLASEFAGPTGVPAEQRVTYACFGDILAIPPNDTGSCDSALTVLVDMMEAFRYKGLAGDPRFSQGFRDLGSQCQAKTELPEILVECRNDFSSFASLLGSSSFGVSHTDCETQAAAINTILRACSSSLSLPTTVGSDAGDEGLIGCANTFGEVDLLVAKDQDTCSNTAEALNAVLEAFDGPSSPIVGDERPLLPAIKCIESLLSLPGAGECNLVASRINAMLEAYHVDGEFLDCEVTTLTTTQTTSPTTSVTSSPTTTSPTTTPTTTTVTGTTTPTSTQYDASIGCVDFGVAGFVLVGLPSDVAGSDCSDHAKRMSSAVSKQSDCVERAAFAAAGAAAKCDSSFGTDNVFTVAAQDDAAAASNTGVSLCDVFVAKLQEATTAFQGYPSAPLKCFGNAIFVPSVTSTTTTTTTTSTTTTTTTLALSASCEAALDAACFHVGGLGVESGVCTECVDQAALPAFQSCAEEVRAASSLPAYTQSLIANFCKNDVVALPPPPPPPPTSLPAAAAAAAIGKAADAALCAVAVDQLVQLLNGFNEKEFTSCEL